jgi:flagellar motility protein MotE (MotC chaperone)
MHNKQTDDLTQSEGKMGKGRSVLVPILITLAVIIIVLTGMLFLIIHNNVNGLADKYREGISGVPLLSSFLPSKDTVSLDKLSKKELVDKYNEILAEKTELVSKLEKADNDIEKLKKTEDEYNKMKSEIDGTKSDLKAQQAELDKKKSELDDYKKQIDTIIANGDTKAFSQYYEKVDPDTAKQIYADIVKQDQTDAQVKKFAQLYATMDASSAAQIFEKMGSTKIDMIAETLMAMNKEASSAILAAMTPSFSAKLTEKLNALYKGTQ